MEIIIPFLIALPVSYGLVHSIYAHSVKKRFSKEAKDHYMRGFNDGVNASSSFNSKSIMDVISEKTKRK